MSRSLPLRIALLSSIVVERDAISSHLMEHYNVLTALGHEVKIFCYRSSFDVSHRAVVNSGDLLTDDFYCAADVIIWHFGIYYEFFNSILVGNGHAKQIVVFHNVTPSNFLPDSARGLIHKSEVQCHIIEMADEIWAVSPVNADRLFQIGIGINKTHVIPLAVEFPSLSNLYSKPRDCIHILFVGRFVQSKGVLDLLEVFRDIVSTEPNIRLHLAGNAEFSDPVYVQEVCRFIEDVGVTSFVKLHLSPSDSELEHLYGMAHVLALPSYHEGFCKPVIEGLRAGCIPVTYDGFNLASISGGYGLCVRTGDKDAMKSSLSALIESIFKIYSSPRGGHIVIDKGEMAIGDFLESVLRYVEGFTVKTTACLIEDRLRDLTLDLAE